MAVGTHQVGTLKARWQVAGGYYPDIYGHIQASSSEDSAPCVQRLTLLIFVIWFGQRFCEICNEYSSVVVRVPLLYQIVIVICLFQALTFFILY